MSHGRAQDFSKDLLQVGYSRKSTIRRANEIEQVIKRGHRYQDDLLRIHVLPQDRFSPSRAVFIVPRFGRTVVLRNRLKRRLQELLRSFSRLSRGYLLVVRVVPETYDADFQELKRHFNALVARIT